MFIPLSSSFDPRHDQYQSWRTMLLYITHITTLWMTWVKVNKNLRWRPTFVLG